MRFTQLILVLAMVSFSLQAFGVGVGRVDLIALGLALWMLHLLVGIVYFQTCTRRGDNETPHQADKVAAA